MESTNDEDAPTSSMQGILAVAQQVHQRELDKRDDYIHSLQLTNKKLEEEYINLQNKYSDLRRSSIEDKGYMISERQGYEDKIASLRDQVKGMENELDQMQQQHAQLQQELSHLASERDKANHIIKNLLHRVRHSPIPH